MSDRELLELAAKAAGMEWCHYYVDSQLAIVDHRPWNPLTDDGDALRLAVKLGVIIDCRYAKYTGVQGFCVNYWTQEEECREYKSVHEESDNHLSATRRAIVRAAAEIGRNMK